MTGMINQIPRGERTLTKGARAEQRAQPAGKATNVKPLLPTATVSSREKGIPRLVESGAPPPPGLDTNPVTRKLIEPVYGAPHLGRIR